MATFFHRLIAYESLVQIGYEVNTLKQL